MSNFYELWDILPEQFVELFNPSTTEKGLPKLLSVILYTCHHIGENVRLGSFASEVVGSTNAFGDEQLDVDVKADMLIFDKLKKSKLVHIASSEENPIEIDCEGTGYSISFDPLDGSSIIDANFAVGSIFGIWEGNGLLGRKGSEQAASLVFQYGPRITVAIALNSSSTKTGSPIAVELTFTHKGWVVSKPSIRIAPSFKTFAPGNLRATFDNSQYKALVDYWIDNKYTLRYSGGLVPDVYHIFIKGGGVLSNASSKGAKAKLRLLYECAPIALIVEAAGGASCVCPSEAGETMEPISVLDLPVSDLDRRIGICLGSVDEVNRFKSYIFGSA